MALLSVVIPVYRAEECLPELYRRLRVSIETFTTDFQIILVEDGGPDRSWEVICELAKTDPRVKGVLLTRNFGQHYAITAGIDQCDGDWVVVMDCDLQDRPEEIPRLYKKAQEGFDIVMAIRAERRDGWIKRMISSFFYWVFRSLTDLPYDGRIGNFRIVSRPVIEHFKLYREQLRFFGALMHLVGYQAASIEVQHDARPYGKSSYKLSTLWRLGVDTILAHSDKPLRMCVSLGFVITTLALIFGVTIALRALTSGYEIRGWGSTMAAITFFSGVIISSQGILGLYIGKIFQETKRRPLYLIAKKVGL